MGEDLIALIPSLLSTAAGGVSAAENVSVAKQNQQQAQLAETQRNQQYDQLNSLVQDPSRLLSNIMAMKRQMSDAERKQIIDAVTSDMINKGAGSSPGLVQEAVDYALTQADQQLFQQAAQSYLSTLGLPASVLRQQPIASLLPTSNAAAGSFGPAVSGLNSLVSKILNPKPNTPGLSGESSGSSDQYGSNLNDYFTGLSLGPSDTSTASAPATGAGAPGG